MWTEVVNCGVHCRVIWLSSFHWGTPDVILLRSLLLGLSRISQLSTVKYLPVQSGGEEDWRSQHLIRIHSFNHLVFNTVPLPLIVLMFPSPKNKILVYLPSCKSSCCLTLWSWEEIWKYNCLTDFHLVFLVGFFLIEM